MQQHGKSARWPVPILALTVFLVACRPALAVRLVRFEILIDGKIVLETSTAGHNEGADAMWGHLKRLPLRPIKGYRVAADSEDPLRATLRGKIIILVESGGRAEVSELKLARDTEEASWKVAVAEVERTLKSRHKPFVIAISIDGKPQLATGEQTRTGGTRDDSDNVWKYLRRLYVVPINRYKVEAESDDPLHATLSGKVRIELKYDGHPWGHAEVSELKLVRERAKTRWKVDPAEVDRTFQLREKPE